MARKSALGLRTIALIEGVKGALVLIVGFGVLSLINKDLEEAAEHIVHRFHMNPAHHYPHIFIETSKHLTNAHLVGLASAAAAYALVRFIEAYGLWRKRVWAEWFAILSGGLYLPIEIYELIHRATIIKAVILLTNLVIVVYLLFLRLKAK